MAQTIKLKRSATTGNAPTTSQLALGELGINTTDGKLFLKKSVSGTESIVEVGGLPLSGGTLTGNLSLGDGVSANFGASNDLTITHTGSSSILKENGTGTFYIQGTDIVFTNSAGSERYADFTDNGAVRLYHDNALKLATTSTGIDVTGSVVADGLTVDTGSTFALSATLGHTGGSQLFFLNDDGGSRNQIDSQKNSASADLDLATGGVKRQKIASNGDISFYNSAGSSQNLFWDSSASSLGIGTTSVSSFAINDLVVGSGSSVHGMTIYTGTSHEGIIRFADGTSGSQQYAGQVKYNHSNNSLNFYTNGSGTSRLALDSSGNATFSGSVTSTGNITTDYDDTISMDYAPASGAYHKGMSGLNQSSGLGRGLHLFNYDNDSNQGINFWVGTNSSRVHAGKFDGLTGNLNAYNSLMVGSTTAPTTKFELNSGGANSVYQTFTRSTGGTNEKYWQMGIGTNHRFSIGRQVDANNSLSEYLTINSSGNATFSGSVSTGNMTLSGQEIDVSSGDLTLDVAGDIILDADGAQVRFQDAGTEFFKVSNESGFVQLYSPVSNSDIKFDGNDGGSAITALTLDMSDEGAATFNSSVTADKFKLSSTNFIDSPTTSIIRYSVGSGDHVFFSGSTSNSELLRINGSNGNVNIPNGSLMVGATTAPQHEIDLTKTLTTINQNPTLQVKNSWATQGNNTGFDNKAIGLFSAGNGTVITKVQSRYDSGANVGQIGTQTAHDFLFTTNGTERMRLNADGSCRWTPDGTTHDMTLTADGNLLVGKTSSSFTTAGVELAVGGVAGKVQIQRSSSPLALVNLTDDGNILGFYKGTSAVGSIATTSGRLSIGSNDVGLFFDSTNERFTPIHQTNQADRDGAIDLGYSDSRFKDLYLSNKVYANYIGSFGDTNTNIYFPTGDQIRFITGGNERARIDASGNLLVGTTGANTYSSTVNTGVQIAPDFIGVARNQNTVMHLNRQGNDGTIVDFRTFGFVRGSVSISGSTTSYNTSSDERLKDNIKDSDDSGSKVDAIQVRQFDWKADGEHQDYGMVAQELLEVAPDAVTQGDTPDDMMGVDYSKLVPMLIKEIQSLRQRVAQLEE